MAEILVETASCSDCGETKESSEFYVRSNGSPYRRCKPCHYVRTRKNRANNIETIRRRERERYHAGGRDRKAAEKRLRKYGLSQEKYEQMLADQCGVCPICLDPFEDSAGKAGHWNIASVDHDHDTGKVRGILHRRCNLILEFGLSEDDISRARRYLAASHEPEGE